MTAELDALEARLDAETEHLRRQKTVNIVVGVILILIVFGYFLFMTGKVKDAMEPQGVAMMASERVIGYLPEARVTLEATARKEVPVLVDKLIDGLLKQRVPEARGKVKARILVLADKAMDDAESIFFDQINFYLKQHGEELRSLAADLSTDEGTHAFEDALYNTLEEAVNSPEIQVDLIGYGIALQELDGMLLYLATEEASLTPEEQTVRELISIFRELMNRAGHVL
jgi:hypothetical protein